MRVVITGGAGFLGSLLAARVLSEGLALGGASRTPVQQLTLVDLVAPQADLADDARVVVRVGGLAEQLGDLEPADVVFHLAGAVSGAAEADFDLGMRTNVDGTRQLLEWARGMSVPPVVVFSSSLAVFGADPDLERVDVVRDETMPTPQSSYGIQKLIGELLMADYTRKGYIRGRSVRLMTVSVRPGKPNAAASSFISGIIREPVAGERVVCPVPPETEVALSSPSRTIDGLVRAAETNDAEWGSRTAMTLPGLTTTPRQMVSALDDVVGPRTSELVHWEVDRSVLAIVGSWPSKFQLVRAARLGLEPPSDISEVIREHLAKVGEPTE